MAARLVFFIYAVFGDVAVRSDGHVKARTVGVGDDVFRPVVIDRTGWKIGDFDHGCRDTRVARMIFELHESVGVGDIERVADESHSERRIESLEKNMSGFGGAIGFDATQ